MKKILKEIFVLVLIISVGIILSKAYCFIIVDKVYHKIDSFREIENRYYAIMAVKDKKFDYQEMIFRKEAQIEYLKKSSDLEELYFEYRNFDTNEKYFLIRETNGNKSLKQNELYIRNREFISTIPALISKIYQNNKFNLKEFLNIYYVIPVKYEDKKCYKIVTKYETIIIDKETFLPKYSCKNWVNSEDDNSCKMEYFYEFEINTVTEEDMQKL